MAAQSAVNWLFILGGFGLGLGFVFGLEGKRRAQQGPWLFYGLGTCCLTIAGFCFVVTGQMWANGRFPLPIPSSALSLSPLPTRYLLPPVISIANQPTPASWHEIGAESTAVPTPQPVRLRIPALHLDKPIQIVHIQEGQWDISQLGSGVGWLETTGSHPGDAQAMVFIGHMTFPSLTTLQEGAFAYLQTLTYGTEVIYQQGETTYHYTVQEIGRFSPTAVQHLYLADGKSILLVTCTDWDFTSRTYANRLVVRATQVN